MQIIITRSGDLHEGTENFIKEKLEKLTTFYDRISTATVHLNYGDKTGQNKVAINIRLAVPGPDVVADAAEETVEKTITEVTEKLRRQLRKLKDKQAH